MKRVILAANSLGKQNHVLVFWIENDSVPVERFEVLRGRQAGGDPVPRHRHVSDVEPVTNRRDARIFDAKLLVLIRRFKPRSFNRINATSVATVDHAQMREEGKPYQALASSSHHP